MSPTAGDPWHDYRLRLDVIDLDDPHLKTLEMLVRKFETCLTCGYCRCHIPVVSLFCPQCGAPTEIGESK